MGIRASEKREHLFKIIFMDSFHEPSEMESVIEAYFSCLDLWEDEDGTVPEVPTLEEIEQIREKYYQVRECYEQIDQYLNEASEGWRTSRMNQVDLSILRLAVFEMTRDEEVPTGVAINEAVELGKIYGGGGSSSFINGILGHLARKQ